MEIYSTEEQQEEAIKRFLRDNGPALVVGAIVGLGGIYGWNYYQGAKLEQMGENSQGFSQVASSSDKPEVLLAEGEKYVAAHGDTQYAQLTQLLMVKALVDKKEFDKATAILNQVIASDVEQAVKSIALTRLARIELAQAKYEQALSTLNKLSDEAFAAQKNEIQGDVYMAQGDIDKARSAYQAAVAAMGEQMNNDLQMKLNDLTPTA